MLDFLKKYRIIPVIILVACVVLFFVTRGRSEVLSDKSKEKIERMSSVERVKALSNTPQIKSDIISDLKTQELLKQAGNPLQLPKKVQDIPTPEDTKKEVKFDEVSNCNEYDHALGKCKLSDNHLNKIERVSNIITNNTKSSLSDETIDGSAKISDAKLSELKIPEDKINFKAENKNTKKIEDDSDLGLLVASSGTLETLKSRNVSIGGAANQIKAGTTVLAVLNEGKTITTAGETYASASVIGAPFERKQFPEGVTLIIKMKLNGTQDGIEGQIVSCASRRSSDKTIQCTGQLEDINGASALRGEVYSNTGWQIVTTAATTFLAGMSLSKITTSATQLGTTVDQTASNALYQALSGAITSMGHQIAASFARSGTQITIPPRVVVRVLFTKDAIW